MASVRPGNLLLMSETSQESTGHETVDAVLASLGSLDELPVGEHVAVFERAHESLRRLLGSALADASQG
jgi:hypothetical protein